MKDKNLYIIAGCNGAIQIVETKLITKNFARVTYMPDNYVEDQQNDT